VYDRIVVVALTYRSETGVSPGSASPALFAHPRLLNLPSNLSSAYITARVQDMSPGLPAFRVLLTDGTVSTLLSGLCVCELFVVM